MEQHKKSHARNRTEIKQKKLVETQTKITCNEENHNQTNISIPSAEMNKTKTKRTNTYFHQPPETNTKHFRNSRTNSVMRAQGKKEVETETHSKHKT